MRNLNDEQTMNSNSFSLIGFLLSEIGLGQAARNIAYSLKQEKLPVSLVNIHLDGSSNDKEFITECVDYQPGMINLLVCGMDLAGCFYPTLKERGLGAKNYLYPFWELDRLPYCEFENLSSYDEIIAPSKFIADTFENFLGKKIRTIPMPVLIPQTFPNNTIQGEKLRIYSSMDFDSTVSRKNPQGAIDAFNAAFPPRYQDVELVLKVRGNNDAGARSLLQASSANDPRIKIIDRTMSRGEIDALINSCNVYLSMHRSEGFGFGPAEALASEKIVVSTDYSGTRDFINVNTGYPVDYKLTPVKTGEYIFFENQLWANPSVESAAHALRNIYDHYESALLRAKNGRQLILAQHSFQAAGHALRALI